jgi:hypothetical protein
MDLKNMVSDNRIVKFVYYRDGSLWYSTFNGFVFPVPVSDIGTATFHAEDKALLFMRYIRKHIAQIKTELEGSLLEDEE